MNLTPEQQAILNGEKGEVLAKVMKTLVMRSARKSSCLSQVSMAIPLSASASTR